MNKPAGNSRFKVNNRDTRTRCVNYVFKLTIKTPEGRSGAFIVNF